MEKPKVLGFVILLYGKPYFRAALEAIYPQVDKIVVLYTDKPSQGFLPDHPCPDTMEELMACADGFWDKVTWIKGQWPHEGAHVSASWDFAQGFDWMFRFDADEVVPEGFVDEMIRQAEEGEVKHQDYRVPFVHFWRSFDRVCRDGQMPMRLTRVHGGAGERYLDSKDGKWFVYHFGYCQPTKYIRYKTQVSGHRPEFRPEWFKEKWLTNAQQDLHPVCLHGFWNAEPFDKSTMPDILKRHPYFNLPIVE